MSNSRKIIKVFIASPGDLQEERQAAKHVIDEFNKQWAEYFGTHVELVGWEDTVSRFGRPQDLINRDLDQCEVFIGIMWKQWGSPPSKDGPYTSGFEEEFERSVASKKHSNRPEISLLFKEIKPEFLTDPGEGLRKVEAFKKKIIAEKTILFQRFANAREFEDKIRGCVTSYLQSLQAEEAQKIADETTAKASGTSDGKEKTNAPSYTPLTIEGAQFIRDFVTKTEGDRTANPITAAEVARFRLLSSIVAVHGNDSNVLGVHDANVLFQNRDEIELSHREMQGLVDTALDNISSENVPLWYWYVAADCEERGYLSLMSFIGSPTERIGALKAMRLVSEPIKPLPKLGADDYDVERKDFIQSWFQKTADERLKVAALEYLSVCGKADDLPLIRTEYERGNYQTVGPATHAILRLTLNESRDAALKALNELQPEGIDPQLVSELFSKPDSIETSLLTAAATHRSPRVRNAAVPILVGRRALPPEIAEQLLNDADATVRFYALRSLTDAGRDYTSEKAKGILIKPTSSAGLGLLSFGSGGTVPDKQGEAFYKTYLRERLRGLSDAALERTIAGERLFDRDARFARDFKKFGEQSGSLRAAIDDKFKSLLSADIKEMEEKLSAEPDAVRRLRSIEETLRKQFCREALDIICEKDQAQDLARVRSAIREGFVEYSSRDVEYLRHHGEWQDVKLLISLVERLSQNYSLLIGVDNVTLEPVASMLVLLGKGRFAELVKLKMPYQLLEAVIKQASDKEITTLSEDEFMPLLTSELDVIRKAAVLKAVRSLPKRRIKALLSRYIEHDGLRYYNVIYWLDFGASLPKVRVLRATKR